MQQVGESFCVHQPVLDGHMEEGAAGHLWRRLARFLLVEESGVNAAATLKIVGANLRFTGPVGGHVGGEIAVGGIDAEGEEFVERGMMGSEAESAGAEQVPVEGFEMAEIENQTVTFGYGAIVESLGENVGEERVGLLPSLAEARQQRAKGLRGCERWSHGITRATCPARAGERRPLYRAPAAASRNFFSPPGGGRSRGATGEANPAKRATDFGCAARGGGDAQFPESGRAELRIESRSWARMR